MFALCIESSHARGLGHLFRSMRLADRLLARGHDVTFVMNRDSGLSADILREKGFEPILVTFDTLSHWEAEIIERTGDRVWVNDRLDTGRDHAERVKAAGLALVTFDDRGAGAALADLHVAALALDQEEYLGGQHVLRGPEFLILAPEIAAHRRQRVALKKVLVTLGGSDTWGVTPKVMSLLDELGWVATVIVGPAFEHGALLEQFSSTRFAVKKNVPSLVAEMDHHDLAVTGGGITPFEAMATGLPCIIIANEDHEVPVGIALARSGGARFAGHHTMIDRSVFSQPFDLPTMSDAALQFVKTGGIDRVIIALEGLIH